MKYMTFAALLLSAATVLAPALRANSVDEGDGGSGCVMCHEDCPIGQHAAMSSGYTLPKEWNRAGGTHIDDACLAGSCESNHGSCSYALTSPDVEELRQAIRKRDLKTIRTMVATHPTTILVNVDRNAFQLANCAGELFAHLPATTALVTHLAEATSNDPYRLATTAP